MRLFYRPSFSVASSSLTLLLYVRLMYLTNEEYLLLVFTGNVKLERNNSRLFCTNDKENETNIQQPRPSNKGGDGPVAVPRPRSKPSIFESVELLAQPDVRSTNTTTSGLQRPSTGSAFSSVVSCSSWPMFGNSNPSVNTNLHSSGLYPTDCHPYAPLTQVKGHGFPTPPIGQPSYVIPSFEHSFNAHYAFSTAPQTSPAIITDPRSTTTAAVNPPPQPPATGAMPSLHQVSLRFM